MFVYNFQLDKTIIYFFESLANVYILLSTLLFETNKMEIGNKEQKIETELVQMRHFTTLKENIVLDIEDLLQANKDREYLEKYIEKNIDNFASKYDIAGSTKIEVHNVLYNFPVLTNKKHQRHIFPDVVSINEKSVEINLHEHKMIEVLKRDEVAVTSSQI